MIPLLNIRELRINNDKVIFDNIWGIKGIWEKTTVSSSDWDVVVEIPTVEEEKYRLFLTLDYGGYYSGPSSGYSISNTRLYRVKR